MSPRAVHRSFQYLPRPRLTLGITLRSTSILAQQVGDVRLMHFAKLRAVIFERTSCTYGGVGLNDSPTSPRA